MKSREVWKWYGFAGHLVVSDKCAYHLCTRVGNFLVSTVGHYLPYGARKIHTIGSGTKDFYETMVFNCCGETKDGDPITFGYELECERYVTSIEAERGHYRYCEEYAEKEAA